jgi:hypothetical protein
MKKTTKTQEKKKLPLVTVDPALNISAKLHYEIISDKKSKMTRARAFEFLELDTFEGERRVIDNHVQFLYNQWSTGRFMWEHVIIGVCLLNDKYYRINGQHTCWMRVNIDEGWFAKNGYMPEVREITYKTKTEEDLRALYGTFDQNKIRSQGHIIRSALTGTSSTVDIWPSIISRLGQSMRLWLFEDNHVRRQVSGSDVAEIVSKEHSEVFRRVGLFSQQFYDGCPFSRRASVTAAMFATFDVAPKAAEEFWTPVLSGLQLQCKTDPRFQLRNFMMTTRQSMEGRFRAVSAEDAYRVCLMAWNKWRKGQECVKLMVVDKRPKVSK